MDEIYDNNQMNQPIESEKIFTLKRKDFDEDKYKLYFKRKSCL